MNKQGTMELDSQPDNNNVASQKIWGKLTSINHLKIDNSNLSEDGYVIGRNATCTISIPDKRLSGAHCQVTRDKENGQVFVEDLSTNGTWLNEDKIGKNIKKPLKNGDTIYLLHKSKVSENDVLGYVFSFADVDNPNKRKAEEEIKKAEIAKDIATEIEKKTKMDEELGEEMQCSICIDYIYQCVTLIPCLHNFCASCYSDWMEKSKECPSCRDGVLEARRNPNINNIIDKYLTSHQDKKRSKEEYEMMDKRNKFTADKIQISVSGKAGDDKKKTRAPSESESEEDEEEEQKCPECTTARPGDKYKCKPGAHHLMCVNCFKPFPDRKATHKQQCVICTQDFCNLYFKCGGSARGNRLEELKNHNVLPVIPDDFYRGNKYEVQVVRDHLFKKKMNAKELFQYLLKEYLDKNKFKYKVNRSILINAPQINLEIAMNSGSPVCLKCFPQVWFQMVFRYRIDIKPELPPEWKNRAPCWYGINCKTMIHNDDHARKLDHAIEQIKF